VTVEEVRLKMKAITPAKRSRPNGKGALPCERLSPPIERSREKKVLGISCPAGSGRTMLAPSYFNSGKAPCFWYRDELQERIVMAQAFTTVQAGV
jgi:ATP/maltotriose-dependent transcriptional regulator MalT